MSIYIISNREVITQNGKEVFSNNGKEHALPIFRIAKCEIKAGAKRATYNIIPDAFLDAYQTVLEALQEKETIEQDDDSEDLPSLRRPPQNGGAGNLISEKLAGSSKLFYELYNGMMVNPIISDKKCDTLVFIHGAATSFNESLDQIVKLHERYMGSNSPIEHLVYISWPSRTHEVLTYWNDQRDARVTGVVLSRVFEKLILFLRQLFEQGRFKPCGSKIHLAAHSMGNQVLKAMLESLPKSSLRNVFGEVVLLHPDVEDTVFEKDEPFSFLKDLAERTHIYIHHSDDALLVSRHTKNFNKRLGKKGPSNLRTLNDETFVISGTKLNRPTSVREALFDHWGYLEREVQVEDILGVFKGLDTSILPNRRQRGNLNYFYLQEKE